MHQHKIRKTLQNYGVLLHIKKNSFFFSIFFTYSNKVEALNFLTIEVMLNIFLYKKTRPWKLKAPSQYCMTGGINTIIYWEHRRCENDIVNIGVRKTKLDA